MAASIADQAGAAGLVAKENEVLAQQAHKPGRLFGGQFGCYGDRHPVATQQLAGRRTRADLCQELVLLASEHHAVPPLRLMRDVACMIA